MSEPKKNIVLISKSRSPLSSKTNRNTLNIFKNKYNIGSNINLNNHCLTKKKFLKTLKKLTCDTKNNSPHPIKLSRDINDANNNIQFSKIISFKDKEIHSLNSIYNDELKKRKNKKEENSSTAIKFYQINNSPRDCTSQNEKMKSINSIDNNILQKIYMSDLKSNSYSKKKSNSSIFNDKNKNISIKIKVKNNSIQDNKNSIKNSNNNNNNKPQTILGENTVYEKCFLCERTYLKSTLFSAECNKHFFCQSCFGSYYKGLLNNGVANLKCPITKCNYKITKNTLKIILDETDYDHFISLLPINENEKSNEVRNNLVIKEFDDEIYNNKHVIDVINSSDEFYNFLQNKNVNCPKCKKHTLFYKSNAYFYKCVNCCYKICVYCFKEYTPTHMFRNENDYCRVYYRSKNFGNKRKKFTQYFLELFLVIVMYYFCFYASFLFIIKLNKKLFLLRKDDNFCGKIVKYLFVSLFSLVFFIIIIPFIVVCYPYFPIISSLLDY